jgi:hypothetical protein
VGDPLPRKIMPDIDIISTRQGSLIGVMVSLSGHRLPETKKNFFLCSVQPPDQTFPYPKNG